VRSTQRLGQGHLVQLGIDQVLPTGEFNQISSS
jgi:hypothetical protein